MKIQFLKYTVLALGVLFLQSCKDYLEQVNPNQMSTETFWKTLDDCENGLNAVYGAFKDQSLMRMWDETTRSDLNYPGWGRPNTSNEYYLQTFTEASEAPNRKWEALYRGVFRANQVIVALEALEKEMTSAADVQEWTYLMGQARFFRGLFYFYLYNSFNKGSVLLFDFVPETSEDYYQPLKPASEIRTFFLADLVYAYENLPARVTMDGTVGDAATNTGNVCAGSAAAVLGKVYLYEEDYETAADYFRDVMTNYGYTLADVSENMTTNGELNNESILEIVYSLNHKPEADQWSNEGTHNILNRHVAPAEAGCWRSMYPACWLIMAYRQDSIDINDPRNLVYDAENDTMVYRRFSLRTSHSIALVDDEDLPYYGKTCAQFANFNNLETGYYRKLTNWDIVETENELNTRSGVNYRVIRLADVMLMYAECLIEGGSNDAGVAEALTYINRVRRRSALQLIGSSATSEFPSANHNEQVYSASTLMDHLMYIERPLELSIEGHAIRHLDLRRWGITKTRFQQLAQLVYHGVRWDFIDEEGEPGVRWTSVLMEGRHPEENPAWEMRGFQQAANNYIEELHGYWPIPSSEIIANPNLYE